MLSTLLCGSALLFLATGAHGRVQPRQIVNGSSPSSLSVASLGANSGISSAVSSASTIQASSASSSLRSSAPSSASSTLRSSLNSPARSSSQSSTSSTSSSRTPSSLAPSSNAALGPITMTTIVAGPSGTLSTSTGIVFVTASNTQPSATSPSASARVNAASNLRAEILPIWAHTLFVAILALIL